MSATPKPPDEQAVPTERPAAPEAALVVSAAELLRGRRELVIEHDGSRYRLRITRRNRLILQK
jgi:hemin uptake protein HemP